MKSKRIVYVGPGLSGRTTSILSLFNQSGQDERRYFDLYDEGCPLTLPSGETIIPRVSGGRPTLYRGADGRPRANRMGLDLEWLCEADGIVFVIDSQRLRQEANVFEFDLLKQDLLYQGQDVEKKPPIFQVNKRDLTMCDLMSLDELRSAFPTQHDVLVESKAREGVGTMEAVLALLQRMRGA
ncbi:hypothetical protein [Chondromyces crocatus]|uniref:Gliding motility protein n=1 Tax=Chondromyces crocatus TaxID=52 RepID=A0A0K1ED71_CHOCO|nr:hypothetical protein [Chondromyces crocatus]AKT38523.1 uncharacterized protein CMC5_026700 [Chondromyces crocatus]